MHYRDPIYGPAEISEPALLDLLETRALQRLNGILQHGISGLVGVTNPTTRLEHSIGTMLLVRRLGGTLEEQIAALVHDVSHTAFSHVIDYVYDQRDSQTYHEQNKERYVANTDLPCTLARHGYDWQEVIDEDRYPILEQPGPALCADRLDYFFRDSVPLGLATAKQIQQAIEHLTVRDRRIAADNTETARFLAYNFIAADDLSWSNFQEVGLYELTAQAIKAGLQAGVIAELDFWTTDAELWDKLAGSDDGGVHRWLPMVSADTRFTWDETHANWWVSTKIRTLDPGVTLNGRVLPLSALDPEFAEYRQVYLERKRGRWPIHVLGTSDRGTP
jgi:hypothetical protein